LTDALETESIQMDIYCRAVVCVFTVIVYLPIGRLQRNL